MNTPLVVAGVAGILGLGAFVVYEASRPASSAAGATGGASPMIYVTPTVAGATASCTVGQIVTFMTPTPPAGTKYGIVPPTSTEWELITPQPAAGSNTIYGGEFQFQSVIKNTYAFAFTPYPVDSSGNPTGAATSNPNVVAVVTAS
jgi:hypothetical protein